MKTRTSSRRLPLLAAAALAIALLHRAGPGLVAGPADAGEILALVGRDAETSSVPRAVLVFQIVDCAESRADLSSWSRAMAGTGLDHSAGEGEPAVVGVLVGPLPDDRSQVPRILAQAGLDFPVRRDASGRVAGFVRALGYRETPVALLLDARGRLRRAGTPASLVPSDAVQPTRGGTLIPSDRTPGIPSVSGSEPTTEDAS